MIGCTVLVQISGSIALGEAARKSSARCSRRAGRGRPISVRVMFKMSADAREYRRGSYKLQAVRGRDRCVIALLTRV